MKKCVKCGKVFDEGYDFYEGDEEFIKFLELFLNDEELCGSCLYSLEFELSHYISDFLYNKGVFNYVFILDKVLQSFSGNIENRLKKYIDSENFKNLIIVYETELVKEDYNRLKNKVGKK